MAEYLNPTGQAQVRRTLPGPYARQLPAPEGSR